MEGSNKGVETIESVGKKLIALHEQYTSTIKQLQDSDISDSDRDARIYNAKAEVRKIIRESGLKSEFFQQAEGDIESAIRSSYSSRALKKGRI